MYIAALLLLLGFGAWLMTRPGRALVGVAVILGSIGFLGLLSFWGEMLWFEAVGYSNRFWKEIFAKLASAAAGAMLGAVVLVLLMWRASRSRLWTAAGGALVGALWGAGSWSVILRYVERVGMGLRDPIFGHDAAFYLFSLPLYDHLYALLMMLGIAGLIVVIARSWLPRRSGPHGETETHFPIDYRLLYIPAAFLLIVYAWGKYLDRFHLMYSELGVVYGPGWTDVNIRISAYWIVAILCALLGVAFLVPAIRDRVHGFGRRPWQKFTPAADALALLTPVAVIVAIGLVGLGVIPALAQWLKVQPSEITIERPYLENNIAFTRVGFRLHEAEDRQFPVEDSVPQQVAAGGNSLLSEIRLWDHRVLREVYDQFQEIRLYYEFHDVDVDRYHIGDKYRVVMVSAREMNQSNLPADSQTFVNKRFKFTHGNGITLTPVSEFTADGLPNLLVRDIPPVAEHPSLEVKRPEVYYGEMASTPVYANSREPEFNYPSGSENVYTRYDGTGGIELRNLWRRIVFGWKFDGARFLLSAYPTPDTRVMFRRSAVERVRALAPFLQFDSDPYIVLAEGRLYWFVEGYTTSSRFPYSEPYTARESIDYAIGETARTLEDRPVPQFRGANYVRNSVKAVVDAYNGSVNLYIFEPEDPVVRVWDRIYPGLFKHRDDMPRSLRAHVRYPHEFLLVQALVNLRYHMQDPVVFYNQEDLWTRATEKYHEQVQAVEPYYIMWRPPEAADPEFIAMLPFTPKRRQVLIGWMAGLCDGDNYGRLITYKFPKDQRVLGPQQVDTKIDQDAYLAGQLTLWNQQGSRVIRGNVLAIPMDRTVLYVEPIFLQAETAAYPELRLVAVMHNDNLSYAETLDRALAGLIAPARRPVKPGIALGGLPVSLAVQANEAFENYLRLQGERRYTAAAEQLKRLESLLQRLVNDGTEPLSAASP